MRISGISQNNFAHKKTNNIQNTRPAYSASSFRGMDSVSFTGGGGATTRVAAFLLAAAGFLTGCVTGTTAASACAAAPEKRAEESYDDKYTASSISSRIISFEDPAAVTSIPDLDTQPTSCTGEAYEMILEDWVQSTQDKINSLNNALEKIDLKIATGGSETESLEDLYQKRADFVTQREQLRDENVSTRMHLASSKGNHSELEGILEEEVKALDGEIQALDKAIKQNGKKAFTGKGSLKWERNFLLSKRQSYANRIELAKSGDYTAATPKMALAFGEGPMGLYATTPDFAYISTKPLPGDDPRKEEGHRITYKVNTAITQGKIDDLNKQIAEFDKNITSRTTKEEYQQRADLVAKREKLRDTNIENKMEWTGSVLSSRETVAIRVLESEIEDIENELKALNKAIKKGKGAFSGKGSLKWERSLLISKKTALKNRLAEIYKQVSSQSTMVTSITSDIESIGCDGGLSSYPSNKTPEKAPAVTEPFEQIILP